MNDVFQAFKHRLKNLPIVGKVLSIIYWKLLDYRGMPEPYLRYRYRNTLKKVKELSFVDGSANFVFENGEIYLKTYDDIYLYFNPDNEALTFGDGQSLERVENQLVGASLELFLTDIVSEGDTILDVGANNGYFFCLKISKKVPTVKIIAFEPDPKILFHLRKNIERNRASNVTIEEMALSNLNGLVEMTSELGASNFLVSPERKNNLHTKTVVTCSTLDNYFAKRRSDSISFVKIDIEGFEPQFFEGSARTMLDAMPVILFEQNDAFAHRSDQSLPRPVELLRSW